MDTCRKLWCWGKGRRFVDISSLNKFRECLWTNQNFNAKITRNFFTPPSSTQQAFSDVPVVDPPPRAKFRIPSIPVMIARRKNSNLSQNSLQHSNTKTYGIKYLFLWNDFSLRLSDYLPIRVFVGLFLVHRLADGIVRIFGCDHKIANKMKKIKTQKPHFRPVAAARGNLAPTLRSVLASFSAWSKIHKNCEGFYSYLGLFSSCVTQALQNKQRRSAPIVNIRVLARKCLI